MKKCSRCGVENKNDAVVCIECGAPLGGVSTTAETASASSEAMDVPGFGQQGNGQMYVAQPVYDQQSQKANAGAMAKAVASLILGIAGLIISCMAPFLEGIPAVLGLLISIIGGLLDTRHHHRGIVYACVCVRRRGNPHMRMLDADGKH